MRNRRTGWDIVDRQAGCVKPTVSSGTFCCTLSFMGCITKGQESMNEVLVALFESEDAAVRAVSALTGAGVPRTSIRRYRRDEYDAPTGMAGSGTTATGAPAEITPHHSKGGFWSWLLGEEGGTADYHPDYDNDYDSYRHAVDAGHVVVAVTVAQADVDRIHDLLEAQSPVRLEDSGPTSASGTEVPTSTAATRIRATRSGTPSRSRNRPDMQRPTPPSAIRCRRD